MPSEKTNQVQMSGEDLAAMMATAVKAAVEEAKKPYVSDEDKKRIEQAHRDREEQARATLAMKAAKAAQKRTCTHVRTNGTARIVHVQDDLAGYLLCQKCQAVIRPGVAPDKYEGTDIYDTATFNRLFQSTSGSGIVD